MIQFNKMTNAGGRPKNEDSVFAGNFGNGLYGFCVADGLGGHGKGEAASSGAVKAFAEECEKGGESEIILKNSFEKAQIFIINEQKRTGSDMKTTMVSLIIKDGNASWGHIGDSRLYYFSGGKLIKKTLDHSVPQMLVTIGEIKEKDIRHHEDRNRLLKVIGTEWTSPQYSTDETGMPIKRGDAFLLCSDGFWEWIKETHMLSALCRSPDADGWLKMMEKRLIESTRNKENDNYSAITIKVW